MRWLGVVDDVRTMTGKYAELVGDAAHDLQTDEGQRCLPNIKLLRERFEPKLEL
jgi:hypothetical protein